MLISMHDSTAWTLQVLLSLQPSHPASGTRANPWALLALQKTGWRYTLLPHDKGQLAQQKCQGRHRGRQYSSRCHRPRCRGYFALALEKEEECCKATSKHSGAYQAVKLRFACLASAQARFSLRLHTLYQPARGRVAGFYSDKLCSRRGISRLSYTTGQLKSTKLY